MNKYHFLKAGADWNLISGLYVAGWDTIEGCEHATLELLLEIKKHHGLAEARRILTKFGSPLTKERLRKIRNWTLLDCLDMMKPEPNIQKLACEIAEKNKTLPPEERYGPRGSINPLTLDKHIRRLCAERDKHRRSFAKR